MTVNLIHRRHAIDLPEHPAGPVIGQQRLGLGAVDAQAFADHGIHFALPMVQVAEAAGEAGRAAVAKEALEMLKKPEAAD